MPDQVRNTGLTCTTLDVTPYVLAPLSKDAVSTWERSTGLRASE